MIDVEPARIAVDEAVLARIARRVADAEIGYAPDDDAGWAYGMDAAWLADLRDHWRDHYDWRAAEAAFNAQPQYRCTIDGVAIHFFRWQAPGGGGYPLLLTHGWPGSPLEFLVAGPLLAAQGHDVIVPSLPGYGFSGRPPRPIGPARIAAMWRRLMVEGLGFTRFGAQGGDWGSSVTRYLARDHADVVGAIHLNMLPLSPEAEPTPAVLEWRQRMGGLAGLESGYSHMHATKPQTIGLALADSPLGFAGWIIEKCRAWSDCGGEVERVFSKDALITNAMTYLATGNVQAGIWLYHGLVKDGDAFAAGPIRVPTGMAEFPAEFIPPAPREAAEAEVNLVRWTKMARGGHFPAWEQPADFAAEVGSFFAEWR
ncbi:epoxide hydrolase family protein [Novosphingobium bradum]|uniref:Epoxide hydrolase family protein n=1 Tax=Novosphingobium bradum TaxID=1737444 RepID=A0ABV7IL88_9SPHN